MAAPSVTAHSSYLECLKVSVDLEDSSGQVLSNDQNTKIQPYDKTPGAIRVLEANPSKVCLDVRPYVRATIILVVRDNAATVAIKSIESTIDSSPQDLVASASYAVGRHELYADQIEHVAFLIVEGNNTTASNVANIDLGILLK